MIVSCPARWTSWGKKSARKEGAMEKRRVRGTDRLVAPFVRLIPQGVKPNHLSTVRATMVVPVAACLWWNLNWLAVIFLAFAVAFDILDGAVARVRGEESSVGEVWDAYADKMLVVGLLLIYGWSRFPVELVMAVVAVEGILCLGRPVKTRIFHKSGRANVFGKIKMWCQSIAMFGLAAGANWTLQVAHIALWLALGFAVLSIVWHIRDIVA